MIIYVNHEHKGKRYIGDGVYASCDGYHIWLTTEREAGKVHQIALDPEVFENLVRYKKELLEILNDGKDEIPDEI